MNMLWKRLGYVIFVLTAGHVDLREGEGCSCPPELLNREEEKEKLVF